MIHHRKKLPLAVVSIMLLPMEVLFGLTTWAFGMSGLGLIGSGQGLLNRVLISYGISELWGWTLISIGVTMAVSAMVDLRYGQILPKRARVWVMRCRTFLAFANTMMWLAMGAFASRTPDLWSVSFMIYFTPCAVIVGCTHFWFNKKALVCVDDRYATPTLSYL